MLAVSGGAATACAQAPDPRALGSAPTDKAQVLEGLRTLGNSPASDLKTLSTLLATTLAPPNGVPVAGLERYAVSGKSPDKSAIVQRVFYTHEVTTGPKYVAQISVGLATEPPCVELEDIKHALGPGFEHVPYSQIHPSGLPRQTDIGGIAHKLPSGARVIFGFEFQKCALSLHVFIP